MKWALMWRSASETMQKSWSFLPAVEIEVVAVKMFIFVTPDQALVGAAVRAGSVARLDVVLGVVTGGHVLVPFLFFLDVRINLRLGRQRRRWPAAKKTHKLGHQSGDHNHERLPGHASWHG
jgi:hypothetical protein